jgi:dsRNA-specific ribonuclease
MEETTFVKSTAIIESAEQFAEIEQQWMQDLQTFIYDLLSNIVPSAKERKKYIAPSAMKIWKTAFTHPSFDLDENYEELEFIGDRVLKAAFNDYLMERFPGNFAKTYTELDRAYMSKKRQPMYSKKLGLDQHVLIVGMQFAKSKVLEDLFEAFMGALYEVAKSIGGRGVAYTLVYNFIVDFFSDIPINLDEAKGHPKTVVQQLFSRFDIDMKPIETITETEGGLIRVTISATPDMMEFLGTKFDIELPGYDPKIQRAVSTAVLGEAEDYTIHSASDQAYKAAMKMLESYGLTVESATLMKKMMDFMDPQLLPYMSEVTLRMEQDGLRAIYFDKPRTLTTNEGTTILLVGVTNEGKRINLGYEIYLRGENDLTAKENLLRRYTGIE